jgi:hypothetical protein
MKTILFLHWIIGSEMRLYTQKRLTLTSINL